MASVIAFPSPRIDLTAVATFPVFAEKQPISSLDNVVQAWSRIVAQNPALRTVVRRDGAPPQHKVLTTIAPVVLGHGWSFGTSEEHFPPAQLVIDLAGTIFQASVHIHRALIDATSSAIIQTSLSRFPIFVPLADKLDDGREHYKAPKVNPEELKAFWKESLANLTTSPFHCFGFKTPEQYADIHDRLTTSQLDLACSFARETNTSLRTVLQSAWALMIAVHSQASNGSVAFSTVGRDEALEAAIGSFDKKYILAIPIDGKTPTREWVQRIEHLDGAAARHAHVGFKAILEEAGSDYLPTSHLHVRAAGSAKLHVDAGKMPSLQLDCEIGPNDSAVSFTLKYDS